MSAPVYLAHRKGLARELNEGDTAARSKLEDQVHPDRLQVRVLQRPRLPGCWHAGCLSSRCLFRGRRSRCGRGWLPQAGGSLWSRPGSGPGDCGVSGPPHARHGISAPSSCGPCPSSFSEKDTCQVTQGQLCTPEDFTLRSTATSLCEDPISEEGHGCRLNVCFPPFTC